ncbi:MAG: hypothetical protein AAF745_18605, partial [Planctomycetota bacterium]
SAGLRWIDLAEDFDILDTASLSTQVINGFRSQVDNEAFGFQLGMEATLWSNDILRLFWGGKYAYLSNDVTGDGIAQNAVIQFEDTLDSSLLEMEIGISARIARWASVEFAYHGLQLYDVAGILSQSRGIDILGVSDPEPISSDIGWNGFHFGFNFMW